MAIALVKPLCGRSGLHGQTRTEPTHSVPRGRSVRPPPGLRRSAALHPTAVTAQLQDRGAGTLLAGTAGLHPPRILSTLPRGFPGRVDHQRLPRRADLHQQLSTPVLRALRGHPTAGGDEPAVHRGPWPAGCQPPPRQPGGGLAALHQGGDQPAGEAPWPQRPGRRRQHPGHPGREVSAFARRPHRRSAGKDPADDLRQRAYLSRGPANPGHPSAHRARLPKQRAALRGARTR